MKYKGITIAAAAFAAGYILKSILVPSAPAELLSALERNITQNPVAYEMVIDQAGEFMHQMKAEANPQPIRPGYAQFKDLRLALIEQQDGDIAVLVNKHTGEEEPVQYINEKTAVGTYSDRLESVRYEAMQDGKMLIVGAEESVKKDICAEQAKKQEDKGILEKIFDFGNSIKPDWFKERIDEPITDLYNNSGHEIDGKRKR